MSTAITHVMLHIRNPKSSEPPVHDSEHRYTYFKSLQTHLLGAARNLQFGQIWMHRAR